MASVISVRAPGRPLRTLACAKACLELASRSSQPPPRRPPDPTAGARGSPQTCSPTPPASQRCGVVDPPLSLDSPRHMPMPPTNDEIDQDPSRTARLRASDSALPAGYVRPRRALRYVAPFRRAQSGGYMQGDVDAFYFHSTGSRGSCVRVAVQRYYNSMRCYTTRSDSAASFLIV